MMADAELEGLARQAANIVQTEFDVEGTFRGMLIGISHGAGLYRMRMIEQFMLEREGPGWVEDKAAKAKLFGLLRVCHTAMPGFTAEPPEAYIFAGTGIAHEEKGAEVYRKETVYATAQTAARVCMRIQPIDGSPPRTEFYDHTDLGEDSLMRMFAPLDPTERKVAKQLQKGWRKP
jgi:hypothetical protein